MAFTAKQHDTAPAYVADLADNFGLVSEAPINLTAATSVRFLMRKNGQTGAPKVSSVMSITDATNGRVQHNWGTADLDTVGTYDVEFEITWTDGTIETVPNDTYLTINVIDDLTD